MIDLCYQSMKIYIGENANIIKTLKIYKGKSKTKLNILKN